MIVNGVRVSLTSASEARVRAERAYLKSKASYALADVRHWRNVERLCADQEHRSAMLSLQSEARASGMQ